MGCFPSKSGSNVTSAKPNTSQPTPVPIIAKEDKKEPTPSAADETLPGQVVNVNDPSPPQNAATENDTKNNIVEHRKENDPVLGPGSKASTGTSDPDLSDAKSSSPVVPPTSSSENVTASGSSHASDSVSQKPSRASLTQGAVIYSSEERSRAAVRIQSVFRGYNTRRKPLRTHDGHDVHELKKKREEALAAKKIQALSRGYMTRKEWESIKEKKAEEKGKRSQEKNEAAVQIQKHMRGFLQRKEMVGLQKNRELSSLKADVDHLPLAAVAGKANEGDRQHRPKLRYRSKSSEGRRTLITLNAMRAETTAIKQKMRECDDFALLRMEREIASNVVPKSWCSKIEPSQCRIGSGVVPANPLVLLLDEHNDWIVAGAVSPDDQGCVTLCKNGSLRSWKIPSGTPIAAHVVDGSDQLEATCVSYADGSSESGWGVYVGYADGSIVLWKEVVGSFLRAMTVHKHVGAVSAIAVHEPCNLLASAAADATARLYNLTTGEELAILRHEFALSALCFCPGLTMMSTGHANSVFAVSLTLVTGTRDGDVCVWCPTEKMTASAVEGDASDGELRNWDIVHKARVHKGSVTSVRFWHSAESIVSTGEDCQICIWKARQGVEKENRRIISSLSTSDPPVGGIRDAVLSPGESNLIVAIQDQVTIVDLHTGIIKFTLHGHGDAVTSLVASGDSDDSSKALVFSTSRDGSACLWRPPLRQDIVALAPVKVAALTTCARGPKGEIVLAGDINGNVHVFSAQTGHHLHSMPCGSESDEITFLRASFGLRHVVAMSNNACCVYDGFTYKKLHSFGIGGAAALFTSNGRAVIICPRSPGVPVLIKDVMTGNDTAKLDPDQGSCSSSVALCADVAGLEGNKDLIAISTNDGLVRVIELHLSKNDITQVAVFSGHLKPVCFCRFLTADGGLRLLTADESGVLKLWDAESSLCLETMAIGMTSAICYGMSVDGKYLGSAHSDGTIRTWCLDGSQTTCARRSVAEKTLESMSEYAGHLATINSLCISPDSEHVASASADGSLRIWPLVNRSEIVAVEADRAHARKSSAKLIADSDLGLDAKANAATKIQAHYRGFALRKHGNQKPAVGIAGGLGGFSITMDLTDDEPDYGVYDTSFSFADNNPIAEGDEEDLTDDEEKHRLSKGAAEIEGDETKVDGGAGGSRSDAGAAGDASAGASEGDTETKIEAAELADVPDTPDTPCDHPSMPDNVPESLST